jgi:hypothetical protein
MNETGTGASVKIYYQTAGSQLTRDEAVTYLATAELPEHILLAHANPAQTAAYRAADASQQRAWRTSYGELTVANGHIVHGSKQSPGIDYWEPRPLESAGIHASDEFGERQVKISTGGTSRDLTTTRGMHAAMGTALELAEAAEALIAVVPA